MMKYYLHNKFVVYSLQKNRFISGFLAHLNVYVFMS